MRILAVGRTQSVSAPSYCRACPVDRAVGHGGDEPGTDPDRTPDSATDHISGKVAAFHPGRPGASSYLRYSGENASRLASRSHSGAQALRRPGYYRGCPSQRGSDRRAQAHPGVTTADHAGSKASHGSGSYGERYHSNAEWWIEECGQGQKSGRSSDDASYGSQDSASRNGSSPHAGTRARTQSVLDQRGCSGGCADDHSRSRSQNGGYRSGQGRGSGGHDGRGASDQASKGPQDLGPKSSSLGGLLGQGRTPFEKTTGQTGHSSGSGGSRDLDAIGYGQSLILGLGLLLQRLLFGRELSLWLSSS